VNRAVVVAIPVRAIVICVLAVAVVLLVRWDYSYRPLGPVPLAIVRDHHGPPEGWVTTLIQREGGLPKVGTPLTHYSQGPDPGIGISIPHGAARAQVFPVAHWEIERISLTTPYNLLTAILKQEAVYGISIEFRVHYADGDTALLVWDTWRYGLKFGPFADDEGGGPAGELIVLTRGLNDHT